MHGRVEVGLMTRPMMYAVMLFGALAMLAAPPADAQRRGEPMELLEAMATGRIQAEFYGNGDQSVRGRISRGSAGPQIVQFDAGTQFQPTTPGRQGMGTLGSIEVDLSRQRIAWVEIPTACTDYDLPAPTRMDRMIPGPPLNREMVEVSDTIAYLRPDRPVAQIAVWAVANDPGWAEIVEWALERSGSDDTEQAAAIAERYRQQAAYVIWEAGINPARYQMFR